jgi:hypothetical protein
VQLILLLYLEIVVVNSDCIEKDILFTLTALAKVLLVRVMNLMIKNDNKFPFNLPVCFVVKF